MLKLGDGWLYRGLSKRVTVCAGFGVSVSVELVQRQRRRLAFGVWADWLDWLDWADVLVD